MILETQLDETQRAFVTKLDFYRTDDQLEEDVTSLLEWISKQPHLPNITGESVARPPSATSPPPLGSRWRLSPSMADIIANEMDRRNVVKQK